MTPEQYQARKAADQQRVNEMLQRDPRELGPRFTAMMRAGVSPVDAYAVMKMADRATERPTPPDIGPVNGGGSQDHEYFSNEELDNLTIDQLMKNPKLLEKANRSLPKIGRKH